MCSKRMCSPRCRSQFIDYRPWIKMQQEQQRILTNQMQKEKARQAALQRKKKAELEAAAPQKNTDNMAKPRSHSSPSEGVITSESAPDCELLNTPSAGRKDSLHSTTPFLLRGMLLFKTTVINFLQITTPINHTFLSPLSHPML